MRKRMGHTAVSATQASSVTHYIWQHGAKENYSKYKTLNMVVNTKTLIIQMGPNILNLSLATRTSDLNLTHMSFTDM